MIWPWLICAAAIGSTAYANFAQEATVRTDAAVAQKNPADSYLSYLLADDILSSGEFRSAQYALGVEAACALVRSGFDIGFKSLQPEWQRLYVRVIGTFGDPGPLSLEGEVTLEQRQLLLALGLAGLDMISEESAGIKNMLMDRALQIDSDAIDYESREHEMAMARSQVRNACGLEAEMESR